LISKRIRSDDLLTPGADGFLLVFNHQPGFPADQAAMRIARDLNTFFIGSGPEGSDVRIGAQHSIMNVDDLDAALEKSGAAGVIAARAAGKAVVPEPAGRLQMRYQPKWDARREALTHNLPTPIHPSRTPGSGLSLRWRRRYPAKLRPSRPASAQSLRRSAAHSVRRRTPGADECEHAHHQPSERAGLSRLIPVMNEFDKDLALYRVIRIAGIEAGFPRGALGDITRMLKVRVPQISLSLNLNDPDFLSALRVQPSAIGCPLTAELLASPRPDLLGRVPTVADIARTHQAPMFVEGDITTDLARQLVAVGVDRIALPLIWPLTVELQGAGKWALQQLDDAAVNAAA
jgi:hypothetical protein